MDTSVKHNSKGVLEKLVEEKLAVQPSGGRPTKASLQNAQRALNERQVLFAEWLAQPEQYRTPRTRAEMAVHIGTTERTLQRWQQNPKVIAATRWLVIHNMGDPSRISQCVDFLHEVVHDGAISTGLRLQAAREFLSAVGIKQVWNSNTPELLHVKDIDEIDLSNLTPDELFELYNERAAQLGAENAPADDDEVVDAELVEG